MCFHEVAGIRGIESVAEHVENPEVLERLQQLGIDRAQGHHLGRPVAIGEFLHPDLEDKTRALESSCA